MVWIYEKIRTFVYETIRRRPDNKIEPYHFF